MPRAPDASHLLRTRSMRGSILILLRRAELSRHKHGDVFEKIAIVFGECVQLFTLHVDYSENAAVRLARDWDHNLRFGREESRQPAGILAYIANDQGLARFCRYSAEPLRRRKSRISRRLAARSCNYHEISPHDLINPNPAIFALGSDHLCGAFHGGGGLPRGQKVSRQIL